MSLENFKKFVKEKPSLVEYVNKKEKTWQDFYEMYELYGENSEVWDSFIKKTPTPVTIKDFLGMFKNIDMSEIQGSINSIQKGIGYIENLVKTNETNIPNQRNYEKRPLYKYFDD